MIWILIFSFLTILIFGVILLNSNLLTVYPRFGFSNSETSSSTIFITEGGSIWSCGSNVNGNTGQGTDTGFTPVPTRIGTDTDWIGFAGRGSSSCFVKENNTLWYCGGPVSGLGPANPLTPTQYGSDTDWASVAQIGSSTTLFIKTDGTLWSCGSNANGKTGQGTDTGVTEPPAQVGSDTDWAQISIGSNASLFIKTDGRLYSCGENSAGGATGQGTGVGSTLTPTQIGSDTDWAAISTFNTYSLFLKTNGTLWVCGSNNSGQTGLGTTVGEELSPVQIGSDTDWAAIAAGTFCSLFLKTNGTLWSCGSNANGRTGQGTDIGETLTPTQIGTDTDWAAISCGNGSSFFIKNNGSVWSCGVASEGRAGQEDVGDLLVPTLIQIFDPS